MGYQNARYKMKIKQSLVLGLALSVALSSSVAQPAQGQIGEFFTKWFGQFSHMVQLIRPNFSNWSTGTKIGAVVLGIGAVAACVPCLIKWHLNWDLSTLITTLEKKYKQELEILDGNDNQETKKQAIEQCAEAKINKKFFRTQREYASALSGDRDSLRYVKFADRNLRRNGYNLGDKLFKIYNLAPDVPIRYSDEPF